jgi:hypothetical protein
VEENLVKKGVRECWMKVVANLERAQMEVRLVVTMEEGS